MNKIIGFIAKKIWVSLFLGFIASGMIYVVYKYKQSQVELEQTHNVLDDLSNRIGSSTNLFDELEKNHAELKSQYETLKEEFAHLEEDRNNVLVQTKELMKDKSRLTDLELQFIELTKKDHETTLANVDLETRYGALSTERESLKQAFEGLSGENKTLKDDLEKIRQDYAGHEKRIKDDDEKIEKLEKELKEFKDLKKEHEQLKEDYEKLKADSKKIAKEFKRTPSKFSKLAEENKTLVEETASMHYNLGVFYAESKKYGKALKEFIRAVDIEPDDAKAHYNIGYIYAKEYQDHEKAIEHFRIYLGLDPADESSDWVRNYLSVRESFDGKILKS